MNNSRAFFISSLLLGATLYSPIFANTPSPTPIPSMAVGTWVYNTTWDNSQNKKPWAKGADVDGLWVRRISDFNTTTPIPTHPINEIIYYAGDLEAYCDGTEQTADDIAQNGPYTCSANSFVSTYYGPYMGQYKFGDPTIDSSQLLKSDQAKIQQNKNNSSLTIKYTCESLNSSNPTCSLAKTINNNNTPPQDFWDAYIAEDLDSFKSHGQYGLHVTSGFRAAQTYLNTQVNTQGTRPFMVADIDARMDVTDMDEDHLDGLNNMINDNNQTHPNRQQDAVHLADFVAKTICADDNLDGVQFDLEPFCFDDSCGRIKVKDAHGRNGQYYFYQEISKDFAGYYGSTDDTKGGVNQATDATTGDYTDPLHCVDRAHPNGRFFSVFTFANHVTPDVAAVFTHHQNGMIVDSLYDLSGNPITLQETKSPTKTPEPAGKSVCPNTTVKLADGTQYPSEKTLVTQEIRDMRKAADPFNLAYQFAIPAGASTHEFTEVDDYNAAGNPSSTFKTNSVCPTMTQGDYIQTDLDAITNSLINNPDPNYKGYDVYGWSQKSWWTDVTKASAGHMELKPDYPDSTSLTVLENNP